HCPQRYPRSALEGYFRLELHQSDADPIRVLLGVFHFLDSIRKIDRLGRLQTDNGNWSDDHGSWRAAVSSGSNRGVVRAVFGRTDGAGGGDHGAAGSGESIRGGAWAGKTASSRLNLTQAFNSLGTTIGPYLGGLLILSANPTGLDQLRQMPEAA